MKKRIITLALLLLSLILALSLCACGDDKEKGEKNDNDEAEVECEHRWVLESQRYPTCASEGEKILRCSYCSERNTVVVPTKAECDYEASWEWYNNNSAVAIYLKCPYDSSHNYSFNGRITSKIGGTVIQSATCQRIEIRKFTAEASYKGKTYYTEKTKYGNTTFHNISYENIPLGENCFDPVKHIEKCEWCGRIIKEHYTKDHTKYKEVARYNLEDYGYCGGYVEYRACQCGNKSVINLYNTCTLTETTEATEIPLENGAKEIHKTIISACCECGFKAVKREGYLAYNGGDESTALKLYEKTEVFISEDITIEKNEISRDETHKQIGHNIKKEYEHLGEECTDGYYINTVCEDCQCEEKKYTRYHTYIEKEVSLLEYDACGGKLILEECHCGAFWDASLRRSGNNCTLEEVSVSEYLGCEIKTLQKAYQCIECGLSRFFGRIYYETGEPNLYYYYDVYSLRINDVVVLDEKIFKGVVSGFVRDDICEKPLTDEEKQAIIDYLENRLNDKTVDLVWSEWYQNLIDNLKSELAQKENS